MVGIHAAQRWFHGSWLLPPEAGYSRALPIYWQPAFTEKSKPKAHPPVKESEAAVGFLQWLRGQLARCGRAGQRVLNDIGFYNLPNTYAAIPGRADSFYYGITVTRAGAARRINAIDTTLTPELRLLIQRILALVPADASATSP